MDRAEHLGLVIALDLRDVVDLGRRAVERRSVALLLDGVLDRLAGVGQNLALGGQVILDDGWLKTAGQLGNFRVQPALQRSSIAAV